MFFLPRCRIQQTLELVSYLRTFITLGVEEEHKPRGCLLIDGEPSRRRGEHTITLANIFVLVKAVAEVPYAFKSSMNFLREDPCREPLPQVFGRHYAFRRRLHSCTAGKGNKRDKKYDAAHVYLTPEQAGHCSEELEFFATTRSGPVE